MTKWYREDYRSCAWPFYRLYRSFCCILTILKQGGWALYDGISPPPPPQKEKSPHSRPHWLFIGTPSHSQVGLQSLCNRSVGWCLCVASWHLFSDGMGAFVIGLGYISYPFLQETPPMQILLFSDTCQDHFWSLTYYIRECFNWRVRDVYNNNKLLLFLYI